jgi:hypothetical protein
VYARCLISNSSTPSITAIHHDQPRTNQTTACPSCLLLGDTLFTNKDIPGEAVKITSITRLGVQLSPSAGMESLSRVSIEPRQLPTNLSISDLPVYDNSVSCNTIVTSLPSPPLENHIDTAPFDAPHRLHTPNTPDEEKMSNPFVQDVLDKDLLAEIPSAQLPK